MDPSTPAPEINLSKKDTGNPNLTSKQEGSHPIGAGLGAAMCGAGVGFASGFFAGPVAAVVGTVAGAFAGGLAGHSISERIEHPYAKPVENNPQI